jgi:hypothetical protein
MAGMFYSLKETAEKLNKTPEEVQEIVRQGRLREFRDGPNLLFKVDEVEALMSDTDIMGPGEPYAAAEEQQVGVDEISLAPEFPEVIAEDKSGLTDADTVIASGGTDVLGETGAAGKTAEGAEDTVSKAEAGADETFLVSSDETSVDSSAKESIEQIEEDVSLDSFGSGSGLLDLSLQADDTSLGGILDEIYAPEGGEEQAQPAEAASAIDLAAETGQMLSEQAFDTSQPSIVQTPEAVAYPEQGPDTVSNAFGIMLFLPLLAVLYTAVVAIAAFSGMTPAIMEKVQSVIWYVVIGLAVAAGVVVGAAFMFTASAGKVAAKPKAKKQKEPKVKKEKKSKKKKEPEA